MAKEFKAYVDQLSTIEYFKYDIRVNYFDLVFNYKNLSAAPYKFEINGIVDYVETREYNIYTAEKTGPVDALKWTVRVPEIANNKIIPGTRETYDNQPASSYNISTIPIKQFIDPGLDYNINVTGKTNTEGPVSKYIGIYQNSNIDIPTNSLILQTGPNGAAFIPTNTEYVIANFITANYYRYGQHPCLIINYDSSLGEAEESEYSLIPLGISGYKVILTNLQTGEKVVSNIQGTLYRNPIYSPLQSSPGLPQPTGSFGTLTLSAASDLVPDVRGLQAGDAKNVIEAYGFIYVDGGLATTAPPAGYISNAVAEQDPPANTLSFAGRNITVVFWPQ